MKIGVFDSGVGGMTVLVELRKKFPQAEFVYFGDTAHVPYGSKSFQQIRKLSLDCLIPLRNKKIDFLVVACNTVSSVALADIEEQMREIPVMGVIAPGVEAALRAFLKLSETRGASVISIPLLVLGTRATIQSHVYGAALKKILNTQWIAGPSAAVMEKACPLLVPMIEEEGWIDHPILIQTLREYLGSYGETYSTGVVLLACTHYPWLQKAIQKVLPHWEVVNPAQAVAAALAESDGMRVFFQKHSLGTVVDSELGIPGQGSSNVEWIFSDPEKIPDFVREFILS